MYFPVLFLAPVVYEFEFAKIDVIPPEKMYCFPHKLLLFYSYTVGFLVFLAVVSKNYAARFLMMNQEVDPTEGICSDGDKLSPKMLGQ